MNFSEVDKIAKTIPGWLSEDETKYLFNTASSLKNKGVIVEIGSYKGKSVAYIGNGARVSGVKKIYCVDPHIGSEELRQKLGVYNSFEEFQQNCKLSKVEDIVFPIVDISENAIKTFNDEVEFIFIDGDHEYSAVKLDFDLWYPKVINGGIMCFHDTFQFGPCKVVWDNVINSNNFKNLGRAGSIFYAEKVAKNSSSERLKNMWTYINMPIFLLKASIVKSIPAPIKKGLKKLVGK